MTLAEIRALEEARYILKTGCTVRACASVFGVGKSTVHSDVTKRLQRLDEDLYSDVAKILGNNLAERHIRGGESTRRRYRG